VTAFVAHTVEAAQARGLAHKRKVAYRAGYAWRVASEAIGADMNENALSHAWKTGGENSTTP